MVKHFCLKLIILGIFFIFIAGCEEERYSIEMKPCGEEVERKLVCSKNLPDDKRKRIARLYEKQIDPNTFWGRFNENLPNDVGGAGFYTCFLTNMGKVNIYSERFRGNDDLNGTLEQAWLVVDQYIDLLIGWLEYELGNEPNFVNLRTFCDNNLRRDCKNLISYFWLANTPSDYKSSAQEEVSMRMVHYLLERGYFTLKESPQIIQRFEDNYEQECVCLAHRFVADKMGYSDPIIADKQLAFLSDSEHAEKSAERYIATTDLYKQLWEAKKQSENDPNADPPDLDIGDIVGDIGFFKLNLFGSTPEIALKLACDSKPLSTNGRWDEKVRQVIWSSSISEPNEFPTFFYAFWSNPNKKFQEQHFGCVVLSDEDLLQYCIWRKSLDGEKTKEWNDFILSLKPSEDLKKKVSLFRFSEDGQEKKEAGVEKSDLAKKPRELILAGLKNKEKERPQ